MPPDPEDRELADPLFEDIERDYRHWLQDPTTRLVIATLLHNLAPSASAEPGADANYYAYQLGRHQGGWDVVTTMHSLSLDALVNTAVNHPFAKAKSHAS